MTDADLSDIDRAALERAVAIMLRDRELGGLVADKLTERSWFDAATFAAFCCQADALGLKPWQSPPCWDDTPESRMLAARLRAAGASVFEPDPAGALALRDIKDLEGDSSPESRRKDIKDLEDARSSAPRRPTLKRGPTPSGPRRRNDDHARR